MAANRSTQLRHERRLSLALSVLILGLVVAGWYSPWLYPFKLLVVYFHELSHALATFASGGRVLEFNLSYQQGGHVMSSGGNRFLILNAGYLGSLLWGILLFQLARFSRIDRHGTRAIALMMLASLLLSPTPTAIIILLAMGAGLFLLGQFGNHFWNDLALRMLGLVSMIYVPLDILSDTILRSGLRSDAAMLAEEFGGSTMLWGVIWLLACSVAGLVVVWGLLKPRSR